MVAIGAALGSVVPVLGTTAGAAVMAVIGGAIFNVLTEYLTKGVDFHDGVIVTVRLIMWVGPIPLPAGPTIVSVESQ